MRNWAWECGLNGVDAVYVGGGGGAGRTEHERTGGGERAVGAGDAWLAGWGGSVYLLAAKILFERHQDVLRLSTPAPPMGYSEYPWSTTRGTPAAAPSAKHGRQRELEIATVRFGLRDLVAYSSDAI